MYLDYFSYLSQKTVQNMIKDHQKAVQNTINEHQKAVQNMMSRNCNFRLFSSPFFDADYLHPLFSSFVPIFSSFGSPFQVLYPSFQVWEKPIQVWDPPFQVSEAVQIWIKCIHWRYLYEDWSRFQDFIVVYKSFYSGTKR